MAMSMFDFARRLEGMEKRMAVIEGFVGRETTAGEFVYRRVSALSSVGVFAAGVATLFLVSYAGHAYYGLYQRQTEFGLMAASTLIGAAVAIRGKLVSIAAISLLGGYLAPLGLQGDRSLVAAFASYL
jgi:uncharacterized membrane protein